MYEYNKTIDCCLTHIKKFSMWCTVYVLTFNQKKR